MEVNEWINGYLEAILDDASLNNKNRNLGNQVTKYFVEEVVTGVEEIDLHRIWIKVVATRNTTQRTCRLQNMCWRIWHLIRKKKQLECEESQRIAKWRFSDVREDMSETVIGDPGEDQHNASSLEGWSDYKKEMKFYIILISLHGLIRGDNMELGRDSDTGGQTKYVVELARALAKMPGVYRVDLFTRQVLSPGVDWSYREPTEMLTATSDDNVGESSGAYIVRIPFGPREQK